MALNRVLLNLTTNALKFTDEGIVEVTARQSGPSADRVLGARHRPRHPATVHGHLFEPFRRRQQDGDYAFSGSGLGLSICRKLVEAMGSELKVETEPGRGTRFSFELDLPLAGEPTSAEPLALPAQPR